MRVPATTANMGPGFDCAGMALDVWNELTVERASGFSMEIEGEGPRPARASVWHELRREGPAEGQEQFGASQLFSMGFAAQIRSKVDRHDLLPWSILLKRKVENAAETHLFKASW